MIVATRNFKRFAILGNNVKEAGDNVGLGHVRSLFVESIFKTYPASRGCFLGSLLACTKSFESLVFRVVGLRLRTC